MEHGLLVKQAGLIVSKEIFCGMNTANVCTQRKTFLISKGYTCEEFNTENSETWAEFTASQPDESTSFSEF